MGGWQEMLQGGMEECNFASWSQCWIVTPDQATFFHSSVFCTFSLMLARPLLLKWGLHMVQMCRITGSSPRKLRKEKRNFSKYYWVSESYEHTQLSQILAFHHQWQALPFFPLLLYAVERTWRQLAFFLNVPSHDWLHPVLKLGISRKQSPCCLIFSCYWTDRWSLLPSVWQVP